MLEFNPLLNQIEQLGRKSTLLNEDIRRQLIQDILLKATSHVHLAHFLLDIEKCQPLESYLDLLSDRALNLQRELIKPKILPEDSDEFQLLEKN
ncbi:MAG: hypothetical protein HWD59_02630 [Coxiellaceae bacterium]|nr:MAG: hypothetical protein HWD59_02630 [Coxiellaceae bacterium]